MIAAKCNEARATQQRNFTIIGARGYSSTEMSNLLSLANLFWTVAGNATHTIFDGFTLLYQKRTAEANYDEAASTYRSTFVGALQNVADTLHAPQADADALKHSDLTRQQIQTGNANVLLLLTAQQTYLRALIQVAQVRANRPSHAAALYLALGGDWQSREGPPAPEQKFDAATTQVIPVADERHQSDQ
jgi:outer membrane protein TolC